MDNKQIIASLSISGEITLNLHALNNEGGEGNQIITRQLTIVDKNGKTHTVNGISGDMFKHIHAGHLINYTVEKKLNICEGCKVADPNRISMDSTFLAILKGVDSNEFEEADKEIYDNIKKEMSELDEKSVAFKAFQKQLKEVEKKYIIKKIIDDSDKQKYIESLALIEQRLEKKAPDYNAKKAIQDTAKKDIKELQKKYSVDFTNEEKLEKLLEMCVIDDTHGILVTAEGNTLPRKSIIEFAWTVGIPTKTITETYVHTKLVADAGAKGSGDSANAGQNIFHRPANTGVYAFVCNVEVYRLGFNDISRTYAIAEDIREQRYKAVIQSLLNTFINPRGAMTSTQKPHITDFKGVVAISHNTIPAPTISALNGDYLPEIEKIKNSLNKIEPNSIETFPFNGLGELSEKLAALIDYKPYKLGE